ncbi:MAG: agmatine deiminase family protein [Muribaculaceae bacterium]|nr:agmatine deiminase family protein [Muribaculaceae bacterium]
MKHSIRYLSEWELDGKILLAFPHKDTDWAEILPEAIEQYCTMVKSFVMNEEELMIIGPDTEWIKEQLDGIDYSNIEFIVVPTNDTWTRDYGPITVVRHDRIRTLDFGFNGWGLKFAADKDNLVNLNLELSRRTPVGMYRNCREFILEGGSIETDGEGALLTTSKCLLSPNRNGGGTKHEIGERLSRELGVDHILWLDYGALMGDDTDSHIDTLCRMAPGNTILFTGCKNVDDPQFEELLHMRAQLSMFKNAEGNPYNLIELPMPDAVYDDEGNRLPATYANYLVTKKALYMPTYAQPDNDRLACNTVRIAFPDHNIVPVDCRTLIKQHGSLHCSTMMVPF